MIHLKVEEFVGGGVLRLDDEARAFLGAGVDDILVFDDGDLTVRLASGEIGRSFTYRVDKAGVLAVDNSIEPR